MLKKRALPILIMIIFVTALAAIFIFPKGLGGDFLPWRLGLDLVGGAHLVYEIDLSLVQDDDRASVVSGLRDVIERRVNLFGISEPQVFTARAGESQRLIVELAGRDTPEAIREIGETPFLIFAEVTEVQNENQENQSTTTPVTPSFIPTSLTGRYIVGASLVAHQITGQPQVFLEFSDEGAKIFEELTEKNIGKQIAVFLDNELITAPIVQEKITGGRAQITGDFSRDDAALLVARFNAGALPAPISLISEQTVSPTLGSNSLNKTLFAGGIGTALVMAFMVLYYRQLGIFAVFALIIYIILTLFVFKIFSVTMTLAGIAGIVLSIGMAVDANILIFERTKEEIKKGLMRLTAIEEGFKRAWLSIRDSNIATIITSIILYYFTSGFIKGFALALLIGVIVSMFSAITVTRTMMRVFIK